MTSELWCCNNVLCYFLSVKNEFTGQRINELTIMSVHIYLVVSEESKLSCKIAHESLVQRWSTDWAFVGIIFGHRNQNESSSVHWQSKNELIDRSAESDQMIYTLFLPSRIIAFKEKLHRILIPENPVKKSDSDWMFTTQRPSLHFNGAFGKTFLSQAPW